MSAHPAITPLSFRRTPDDLRNEGWSKDHVEVYRLVREMGLAAFAPSCIVRECRRVFKAGEHLVAVPWVRVVDPGWSLILDRQELPTPLIPPTVSDLSQEFTPSTVVRIDVVDDEEQAPLDYGVLVELMRSGGYGRPSTYAEMVGKMLEKKWVASDGGSLRISDVGERMAKQLASKSAPDPRLTPEYSGDLERQLAEVEHSHLPPSAVLDSIAKLVGDDLVASLEWLDSLGAAFEGESAERWHAGRDAATPPPATVAAAPEPERRLPHDHVLRTARNELFEALGRAVGREWKVMRTEERAAYMIGALRIFSSMDETRWTQRLQYDALVRWAALLQGELPAIDVGFDSWLIGQSPEDVEAIVDASNSLGEALGL